MIDRESVIRDQLMASIKMKEKMAEICVSDILRITEKMIQVFQTGNKVLICGNGGSAADAQHIAAELVGRFQVDRSGLPAIALTTDTSILTSIGNDYGFETIFSRQVEALGQKGDILIGFSTSGSSKNVVLAMKKAKQMGLITIAFVGQNQGPVSGTADIALQIPSQITARIQEGHQMVGHIVCDLVERALFGKENGD